MIFIVPFFLNIIYYQDMAESVKKEKSYKESVTELESIIEKIENGEMDVDELSDNVALASELIKCCKDRLYKTNESVEKLIKDLDKAK